MRNFLFCLCLVFNSTQLFAESETLEDAVKDYKSLQRELDAILSAKTPDCTPDAKIPGNKAICSLKEICSMNEINSDGPILYQNKNGEKIVNDQYYQDRDDIRSCLKEKYADEIKEKRDELTDQLKAEHLKKIIAANQKLAKLTKRYGQGAKIQKISNEILSMSLEIGENWEYSDWEKPQAKSDLMDYITRAENRTNISLNPEIKKTLVAIQYLKKDHQYLDQVDAIEKVLIPEEKPKDPFFDWTLLTDEKAAGGQKALEANRARLVKKTQDAYEIFKETQQELLAYLESKKNESNIDKIERIIERVKTIRFNPPRLTDRVKRHCSFPNAFYSLDTHAFTICPQMLDYPKTSLMEAMAHEIAHSFDSCSFSGVVHKTKGPRVVEEAPFEIEINMDQVSGNYKIESLISSDSKNRIQDKMLYKDNPFSKTLSCLEGSRSVEAQGVDLSEIKKNTKEELAKFAQRGADPSNNVKARYLDFLSKHQKEYFDYFRGCDQRVHGNSLSRSQMEEAFADKISSEIVARKLKNLSKSEAEKMILEITLSYGDICLNDKAGAAKLREFAVKEKCPGYYENKSAEDKILSALEAVDPEFDPHPESGTRIEQNLLAHPEIRKALKCPWWERGRKYCE